MWYMDQHKMATLFGGVVPLEELIIFHSWSNDIIVDKPFKHSRDKYFFFCCNYCKSLYSYLFYKSTRLIPTLVLKFL